MKRFFTWLCEWTIIVCILAFWIVRGWWCKIRGKEDDWF